MTEIDHQDIMSTNHQTTQQNSQSSQLQAVDIADIKIQLQIRKEKKHNHLSMASISTRSASLSPSSCLDPKHGRY